MNNMVVKGNKSGMPLRDDRYGTLWELVASVGSACKTLGLAYVEVDPGKESPAHFHRQTEEVYHVVSGYGVATLNNQEAVVGPGDTVVIPVDVIHKIRASSEGLAFIVVTSPPYNPDDDIEV